MKRFRFAAAAAKDGNDYFILLIVTDGIITDMPQTTEAIVNVRSVLILIIFFIVLPEKNTVLTTLDNYFLKYYQKVHELLFVIHGIVHKCFKIS